MTRTADDNSKTLDAFLADKIEIDTMLEQPTTLSGDYFEAHCDEIDWGDVGTLNHYRAQPREITDMGFREDEYAA